MAERNVYALYNYKLLKIGKIIFYNASSWLKVEMHMKINNINSKHPKWQIGEANVHTTYKYFMNS